MSTEDQIKDMRRRILAGEEVPQEELADCLNAYRESREATEKKKTAKKEKVEEIKQKQLDLNNLFKK